MTKRLLIVLALLFGWGITAAEALTLRVCNKGTERFDVLLSGQTGFGKDYVAGWFGVSPGRCFSESGGFQHSYLFAIAYTDASGAYGIMPFSENNNPWKRTHFQESKRKVCVVPGKDFERTGQLNALAVCKGGEVLAPINIFTTGMDLDIHTLNVTVHSNVLHSKAMTLTGGATPDELMQQCKAKDGAACMELVALGKDAAIKAGDVKNMHSAGLLMLVACQSGHYPGCTEAGKYAKDKAVPDEVADFVSKGLVDICFGGVGMTCMHAAEASKWVLQRTAGSSALPGNYLEILQKGCELEDINSCNRAGQAFEYGWDTEKSPQQEFAMHKRACELSLPAEGLKQAVGTVSCFKIGKLAESGRGLSGGPNLKLAKTMYALVCVRGGSYKEQACERANALQ